MNGLEEEGRERFVEKSTKMTEPFAGPEQIQVTASRRGPPSRPRLNSIHSPCRAGSDQHPPSAGVSLHSLILSDDKKRVKVAQAGPAGK